MILLSFPYTTNARALIVLSDDKILLKILTLEVSLIPHQLLKMLIIARATPALPKFL